MRLDRSKAERQEQIARSCQITEEEARKQVQGKRRSWIISSEFLAAESDEIESCLAKHALGRG